MDINKKNITNKKGFTLIELLAVIVILGVILLIAVPSVAKLIVDSKIKSYENSIASMVKAVTLDVASGTYTFNNDEVLIVPFSCIELESGSSDSSPFGKYVGGHSFVAVIKDVSGYHYYASALDAKGYGVPFTNAYGSKDDEKNSITVGSYSAIQIGGINLNSDGDEFDLARGISANVPSSSDLFSKKVKIGCPFNWHSPITTKPSGN